MGAEISFVVKARATPGVAIALLAKCARRRREWRVVPDDAWSNLALESCGDAFRKGADNNAFRHRCFSAFLRCLLFGITAFRHCCLSAFGEYCFSAYDKKLRVLQQMPERIIDKKAKTSTPKGIDAEKPHAQKHSYKNREKQQCQKARSSAHSRPLAMNMRKTGRLLRGDFEMRKPIAAVLICLLYA